MKLKINYFVIPIGVLLVSALGGRISGGNMAWYQTLQLPNVAPSGFFIGIVWMTIFILSAVAILLFWNQEKDYKLRNVFAGLFIVNGLLNVFWSVVFFGWHLLGWAIVEMTILNLLNLVIIVWLWNKDHKISSILFWPYFVWVGFATYLAYSIWQLNF